MVADDSLTHNNAARGIGVQYIAATSMEKTSLLM